MTLPADVVPYILTPRRFCWRAQCERTRTGDVSQAAAFHSRRLEHSGTALPASFPSRVILVAAGVLAVEEVVGAGVTELMSYGLSAMSAEALILWLERRTMTAFALGPRVGQIYEEDDVTLLASAARTASVTSDVYEVGDKGTLRLLLAVTALSGTGAALHVQVETAEASSPSSWRVVDAFGPLFATGSHYRSMSGLDRFVRVVCTIAGSSPSITFALTGTAV